MQQFIFPEIFVERIKKQLGSYSDEFFATLQSDSPVSIRVNPKKKYLTAELKKVPWSKHGYYLAKRPVFTLDPLFHAGSYYVQEASSMFLEVILSQTINHEEPLKVLDLCAAPGGKSTHLLTLLSENSLLIANEVIRSRSKVLAENITKWGYPNVIVTNNDPADFARLPGFFDVMLIDAPCSGEGLFRKDPKSVSEWSDDNVKLCASRQRRIIADSWDTLKPGGILIYSTCTYNTLENEDNINWLINEMGADTISIDLSEFEGIIASPNNQGIRFFPHKVLGEGFFISVLRKNDGDEKKPSRDNRKLFSPINNTIINEISNWIEKPSSYDFWGFYEKVFSFPKRWQNELFSISNKLSIVQCGVEICEVKAKNLLPSHSLAVSTILKQDFFTKKEVPVEEALRFQKRDDIKIDSVLPYILLVCKENNLGFMKKAGNRYNNLYPKEWRIRMDIE